jgi:hypothetical protein
MLIMQGTQSGWKEFSAQSPVTLKAHIDFMISLYKSLVESGELVLAEGLASPDQAKIVRARKGGPPAVTDGPFPESKEFLAGWWIVDCENLERAIAIAAKASSAPGPNGGPLNMPIEVRQVMSGPPDTDHCGGEGHSRK